jgi:hypothetical protein
MFEFKPDYERSKQRIDAFWERELVDRPVVQFTLPKSPEERVPVPKSNHSTSAERWLDVQYQAELTLAELSNSYFLGDTMPVAYPNLGPEVFSALYGCPLHFGDYGTSWTEPILRDWFEADKLQLNWNSPYLKKLEEITDALLEVGRSKFIVGMTDWHPGGDAIAAFRDPQVLAMDMIDHVAEINALLVRVEADYFKVYDHFYHKLKANGQPISTWIPLVCDGRYYVPSIDFIIMISNRMFEDVFLPGIVHECQFLDHSIFHMDGPGALRHLNTILSIPELDALQFVPGAGNEGFHKWVWVYRKAQRAGKGIEVLCRLSELELIMQTLDPHGLFLSVEGVTTREEAQYLLKRLEKWTAGVPG